MYIWYFYIRTIKLNSLFTHMTYKNLQDCRDTNILFQIYPTIAPTSSIYEFGRPKILFFKNDDESTQPIK